jgi:hypothetical protein
MRNFSQDNIIHDPFVVIAIFMVSTLLSIIVDDGVTWKQDGIKGC